MLRLGKARGGFGRYSLAQAPKKGVISPTVVNLAILGAGLGLGFVTYQYREKPLGAILLSAAGSMTAVALVLFLRDLLIGNGKSLLHPSYEA